MLSEFGVLSKLQCSWTCFNSYQKAEPKNFFNCANKGKKESDFIKAINSIKFYIN